MGNGLGPRLGAVGPAAAEVISSLLRAWTLPRPGTMYWTSSWPTLIGDLRLFLITTRTGRTSYLLGSSLLKALAALSAVSKASTPMMT